MPSIVRYQQYITRDITRTLEMPEEATELCTLDGWTYVSLPDGVSLPADQPTEIAESITPVVLDAELCEAICNASPHVRLIRERVRNKIAEQYDFSDEIKLIRTAPSPEFEVYNTHAEDCRAWGREQKALLGISLTHTQEEEL